MSSGTAPHPGVGKRYAPVTYAVGREKIREYAAAVGETNAVHHDLEAARAAGYADLVAPPMFAVVYAARAVAPAVLDPELAIDFARLVHGAQHFRWGRPVIAGDEVTTTATVSRLETRGELQFLGVDTESVDASGETVCSGVWTNIIRLGA